MKKNLWDYLAAFLPSYWLMNNPYSRNWDKKLMQLLDDHKFAAVSQYLARLGTFKVWINNHPYASFEPQMLGLPDRIRPSRSTIHYAMRRLRQDLGIHKDPFPAESAEVQELEKLWKAR